MFLVPALYWAATRYGLTTSRGWTVHRTATPTAERRGLANVDRIASALLLLCFFLQVGYKAYNSRLAFIFQPCHVMTLLLFFLSLSASGPRGWADVWFNVYLHLLYAPLSALLFPDVRDLEMAFEVEVFFAHHFLLAVLPLYYIFTGRFTLFRGNVALGWLVMYVYHLDALAPLGIMLASNLNYMMHPPVGVRMEVLGRYYRFVVAWGCLPACYLVRHGFVTGCCTLLGVGAPSSRKAKQSEVANDAWRDSQA